MKTWVVLSDLQIPWQDKRAVELAVTFIEDIRPYGVVLNGDITDAYELSDYDKNPKKDYGLDREIREAGELMARLAKVTKARWWIEGNHEDRLRRTLWRQPKFARIKALQFPELFRLGEYGFKWKPYGGVVRLGKLLVTHGDVVRQHSGWTARAHFEKYGQSILVGHTHRLGSYFKTNGRGTFVSYENGTLAQLKPEYVKHPDWQQGFSVVHVEDSGLFAVQQLPILRRRMLFYGSKKYELKGRD